MATVLPRVPDVPPPRRPAYEPPTKLELLAREMEVPAHELRSWLRMLIQDRLRARSEAWEMLDRTPRVATVTTDWSDIENEQHRPPNVGYTSVPPETAADRGALL